MKNISRTIRRSRWVLAACLLLIGIGTLATAPAGRYTTTADTVTDTVTGLVWQRNVDNVNGYTWAAANSYCESLDLGGWSTGWRLPTIKELQSIVDVRSHDPAIDRTAFPNTQANEPFWSSSPYPWGASLMWSVWFGAGATMYDGTSNSHRVRCVR